MIEVRDLRTAAWSAPWSSAFKFAIFNDEVCVTGVLIFAVVCLRKTLFVTIFASDGSRRTDSSPTPEVLRSLLFHKKIIETPNPVTCPIIPLRIKYIFLENCKVLFQDILGCLFQILFPPRISQIPTVIVMILEHPKNEPNGFLRNISLAFCPVSPAPPPPTKPLCDPVNPSQPPAETETGVALSR